MAALFITGLATGAAMVLEFQKRRELTKKKQRTGGRPSGGDAGKRETEA